MTPRTYILIATFGSAAVLLGAFAFQHLGGLAPCKLCLWQRWPHAAAIVIGGITLAMMWRPLMWLGAASALLTAGYGLYHVGVEQGWWEGPTTCTSGPIGDLSADDLMAQIMTAPLVRCDDIAWQMLGLSMAGWNMVISLGLALIWLRAATTKNQ